MAGELQALCAAGGEAVVIIEGLRPGGAPARRPEPPEPVDPVFEWPDDDRPDDPVMAQLAKASFCTAGPISGPAGGAGRTTFHPRTSRLILSAITAGAMAEPVRVSPRVAAVLLKHLDARRLRIQHRTDAEVYAILIALAELAICDGSGDGTGIVMPAVSDDDSRMTVLQAARKAGVSARAIIKAIDTGRLEAWKVGPIWQVSERSLARYMAARARQEKQREAS